MDAIENKQKIALCNILQSNAYVGKCQEVIKNCCTQSLINLTILQIRPTKPHHSHIVAHRSNAKRVPFWNIPKFQQSLQLLLWKAVVQSLKIQKRLKLYIA